MKFQLCNILRNATADNGADNGGGKSAADDHQIDPKAAIAAIEDKTLPMSRRLSVALKALQGIPPAEQFSMVSADLKAAKARVTELESQLAAANAQVTALQADITTLETSNAALEQANKDLRTKDQTIEGRAQVMVNERVAALGFPSSQLPAPDAHLTSVATADEAMSQYASIKDPKERAAFYQKHILPRLGKPD